MISPEEVEQVLHSHDAIEEAAIIGVPDIDWGERVRAVVVLKDGQTAGRWRDNRVLPPAPGQLQEARVRSVSYPSCRAITWAKCSSACSGRNTTNP